MPKSHVGKWGLRDYLYYQLNQGDSFESPLDVLEQKFAQEDLSRKVYEIGLIAATQAEAVRFLGLVTAAMRKHLTSLTKHHFTAYGLDQAWRPQQLFDEVHWLNGSSAALPPQERLATLGSIVHINLLERIDTQIQPGFRAYRWESESDLTEFWASLYLARETNGIPCLDWASYNTWQAPLHCLGQATASWGEKLGAAIYELLVQTTATRLAANDIAILIIEGSTDTTLGDYVEIVNALERSWEFDIVPSGWVSPNYSGYGLKLLRFYPP